eukprot:2671859-Pleurochrysis_carterae.AAC.1
MQRAMLLGTLLVFGSGAIGWWITKKVLGVANIAEFGEKMKEKFPKARRRRCLPFGHTHTYINSLSHLHSITHAFARARERGRVQ